MDVLTWAGVLGLRAPRFRFVWCKTGGLCGMFSTITCQHTLRDSDSILWTKQLVAARAGEWEKGKGLGTHLLLRLLLLLLLLLLWVSCEMSAPISSWLGLDSVDKTADSSTGKGEGNGNGYRRVGVRVSEEKKKKKRRQTHHRNP
jgi:hypothetical protein